jgi:protein O-GlcNAc transferase
VTWLGASFAGRVAASLLLAVGMSELITDTLEDYEALALRIARDPELLRSLRERLAQNGRSQPLFDSGLYRRNLESAYLKMWETWQRGDAPASFAV